MDYPDVLRQLIEGADVSLASWFARPLSVEAVQAPLAEVRRRLCSGRNGRRYLFGLQLAELVCRYWAGRDSEAGYRNLAAMYRQDREQASLELCYGQLLIARKLQPAWLHLDRGFELAAHLLAAEDYFVVLRRHALLRQLPISDVVSEAAPLSALLSEAQVIARLRGRAGRPGGSGEKHQDTVD